MSRDLGKVFSGGAARFCLAFATIFAASQPLWSQQPANMRRTYWSTWPSVKYDSIPKFVLNERYKDRTAFPLPSTIDHSKNPLSPVFSKWHDQGYACGNSSAGMTYSYEVQKYLNLPSTTTGLPLYTYEFTYHFLNGGDFAEGGDSYMVVEAFDIIKQMGIPSSVDFGGFEWGNSFNGWMSGYDKYYRAMKLRGDEYYKVDLSTAAGDELAKQYLVDQGDLSSTGGFLSFQACDRYDKTTVSGRPAFGSMEPCRNHAMNIVGYDDNFNGGSYLVFDQYAWIGWMPYKFFKSGQTLSGTYGTPAMFLKLKKNYTPKLTLKITLTHNQRERISIRTGVAPSTTATTPTKIKDYGLAFNFAGGLNPMGGKAQSATLEFGLDLTDLTVGLTGQNATFFLQVLSKGGAGTIDKVTLMDYTGATVKEIPATEAMKVIAVGTTSAPATTLVGIPWTSVVGVKDALTNGRAGQGTSLVANRNGGLVHFSFSDETATHAALTIRDVHGRSIFGERMAITASSRAAGFPWALKNLQGESVNPGLYFASLELSKGKETVKKSVTKIQVLK